MMVNRPRIKVLFFAQRLASIFFLIGLVLGVFYSFGGFFLDLFVSPGLVVSLETPGISHGTFLAFGALIGMPFISAISGFLSGIIVALLYNTFSS